MIKEASAVKIYNITVNNMNVFLSNDFFPGIFIWPGVSTYIAVRL